MKNTKFTKIAILALSVALLIGAAIGFSVNAEDAEPQYEIIARNVVYGETVPVVYAVNVEVGSADAANVQVAYYYEKDGKESWTNATALDTSDENNIYEKDGKQYITFATNGVVPKKLGDVIFATVYTGTAPADDAVWVEYSAAEYFYNRLYEDGFVNMEEADGNDYQKKLLYEAQLEYSTRAQLVLGYEEGETLVKAYNYAYSTDEYGKVNDAKSAFDVATVTATYNNDETPLKLVGWTVTYKDIDGTDKTTKEYGPSDAIDVEGVTCIEPKLEAHTCADNNGDHFCDSCTDRISYCADSDSDGRCDVCKLYSFEYTVKNTVTLYTYDNLTDKNLIKQDTITEEDTVASYYGYAGQLIADPADATNKVLQVLVNDGNQNSDTSSGVNNISNIKLVPQVVNEGGKVHVIEFDFNLMHFQAKSGTTIKDPFSIFAYDAEGNCLGELQHYSSNANYGGFLCFDSITNEETPDLENNYHFGNNSPRTTSENEPSDYAMFDAEKWYRFRFIWNEADNSLYFDVSFDEGKTWYKAYNGDRAIQTAFGTDAAYVQIEFLNCWQKAYEYLFDDLDYTIVDTVPTRPDTVGNDSVEFPNGR